MFFALLIPFSSCDFRPPTSESLQTEKPTLRGDGSKLDANCGGEKWSIARLRNIVHKAIEGVGKASGIGQVWGAIAHVFHDRLLVQIFRPTNVDHQVVHGGQSWWLDLFYMKICYRGV